MRENCSRIRVIDSYSVNLLLEKSHIMQYNAALLWRIYGISKFLIKSVWGRTQTTYNFFQNFEPLLPNIASFTTITYNVVKFEKFSTPSTFVASWFKYAPFCILMFLLVCIHTKTQTRIQVHLLLFAFGSLV